MQGKLNRPLGFLAAQYRHEDLIKPALSCNLFTPIVFASDWKVSGRRLQLDSQTMAAVRREE
jgi:hypothetical protein